MSRRRASYRPYEPLDMAAVAREHYGESTRRDPANLTIMPEIDEPNAWLDGLRALVLAVGGALLVAVAWWAGMAWVLGARWPW